MVESTLERWRRIDVLHDNVGVSLAGGDGSLLDITEEGLRHHFGHQSARLRNGLQVTCCP